MTDNPTLWQVTTIAPNGQPVTTHGHTTTQAVREMLRRRKRGHRLPSPCATPEAELCCQSTNHDRRACYGDLWTCAQCGKTVCYAEGTTDYPEICDDCWAAKFAPTYSQQPAASSYQPTAEGRV